MGAAGPPWRDKCGRHCEKKPQAVGNGLRLGLHWDPKLVILQGRGVKNQQIHFFQSGHLRNSIFDGFWSAWSLHKNPKIASLSCRNAFEINFERKAAFKTRLKSPS